MNIPRFVSIIFLAIFLVLYIQLEVEAQTKNGFNLKGAIIPVNEIMNGGPPRERIPSIDYTENKKDVKKARKQARKEEQEKRRQERLAKRQEWQESNGDYRGNSEYYYPYYPYSHRSSYFHGYRYHASHNIFLFKLHPLDKHSLNVFGIDIVNQITELK